ncbi:hypothetical protein [Reyranella sp.]|uniref:hypothetical protein n=1 Tax=Reyranella sp. TaxID=1929291 RepID=UPI003D09A138
MLRKTIATRDLERAAKAFCRRRPNELQAINGKVTRKTWETLSEPERFHICTALTSALGALGITIEDEPAKPANPAAFFHSVGVALYGDQYVAPLAFKLKAEKNTLGKWRDGKSRIPGGVWNELSILLHNRGQVDFRAMEMQALELALEPDKPWNI